MRLSFGDKAHILTSSFSFWIGAFFLFIGICVAGFLFSDTDFDSLQFYSRPVALTTGYIAGTEPTNSAENDNTIIAIYYRYQVDKRSFFGRSYSSGLSVRSGEQLQVEYVAAQPEYARILGTRNAPYSLWTGILFILIGPVVGLIIIYQAFSESRDSAAIITDAYAVTGSQIRATTKEVGDDTVSYLVYEYEFNTRIYTHTIETNYPGKYSLKELLFIKRTAPANAVCAREIPTAIRERILSSIE